MEAATLNSRAIQYAITAVGLSVAYLILRGAAWEGGAALHTLMEVVATLLAFVVGGLSLVRYYSKRAILFLFIGVGFIGTAFLDGYHAIVTSTWFKPMMPSDLTTLIPWSWIASRQFLSVFMVLSWWAWWREESGSGHAGLSDRNVYLFSLLALVASFLFFAFFPLPPAYYPDLFFHRPEEFVPAAAFLAALVMFLRTGHWRHDIFQHWLVLSLIVGFVSQAVFMSFSGSLFDFEFDAAHSLKKISYICVLTGLVFSIYAAFRSEEQLAQELTLQRLAVDEHAIVSVADRFGHITYANQSLSDISGYSGAELIGQKPFLHGGALFEEQMRVTETGKVWQGEIQNRTKDGQEYWVKATLVPKLGRSGKPVAFIGIQTDITEQKRVQSALKTKERDLRLALSHLPGALVLTDPDLNIIVCSERFYEIYHVPKELLQPGKHYPDFLRYLASHGYYGEGDMEAQVAERVASIRNPSGQMFEDHRPDGRIFAVHRSLAEEGHTITVVTDISELKEANRIAVEGKEKAEAASLAKSRFLASMSHELRTPMTGVIGFADLLLDDDLPAESRNKIQRIKGSANTLLRLLNDILDMSKLEAGKMEVEHIDFWVKDLIEECATLTELSRKSDDKVKIVLKLPEDFPVAIKSDPTRLRQILVNLIGNAVKFTHQGQITVHGAVEDAGDQGRFLRVDVEDTGIGIDEISLENLFGDFTQADASISRRYSGTGLGLSICKRLVELLDGEIGVESEEGVGSRFWFRIPFDLTDRDFVGGWESDTEEVVRTETGLNILIAEDNRVNQLLLKTFVEKLGHTATIAENGIEAVKAHMEGDFDLILMDVRMPEMSGTDATQTIRAREDEKSTIPIIAVTADAMKENMAEYTQIGMNACISKPVDRLLLAKSINAVMGQDIHIFG